MFDLFDTSAQNQIANAKANPARTLETSPGEAFKAAWEANERYRSMGAMAQNTHDAAQDWLDGHEKLTGQKLPNPYAAGGGFLTFDYDAYAKARREVEGATQKFAVERNDPAYAFPDDQALYRAGVMKARAAMQRAAQAQEGHRGFGATLAELGAGLLSPFGDPVDASLNAIAMTTLPVGGGLIRSLATVGGAFAAQEALQGAINLPYQQAVTPERGISDVAKEALMAGAGGMALDLGGRGVGALWRRFVRKAPEVAASLPQEARDAATVAERAADLDAQNPFRGPAGEAAYNEAVPAVERALINGEPVVLPQAVADEARVRTGRAFVGTRAVDVRYELAEARDLVASHDRDFRVNPEYPAELQPRDRSAAAARDQVYDMAAKLEPGRLGPSPEANSGAPIIGLDNVVESGNGRTLAIRAAYDQGGERSAAYRAFLERSGFDTSGFKEPVLVARRVSGMSAEERAEFAHAANGSASLRMNAVEQALSDARHIAGEAIDLLQAGAVDSAANRDFVRALIARMPQGERGGMVTATGQLSQAGVRRVQAALVARAYGDPGVVARAFDHAEPNIKTIAAALTEAAPDWIRMREAVTRGEVAAGHDITEAVMTAVKTIMRARDEGEPVTRALAQGDFFASDTSGLAARLFFKDNSLTRFLSKKDMGENLQTFAQAILEQRGKGEDLFGAPPPDTRQVLGGVARLSDARQSKVAEALKPEQIEKAFTDPKVHEAAEADLRRQIEQGKNRVPVEDADGNVTMGFADAELKRIDDEIAAANEIKACSTVQTEVAE